MKTLSKIIMAGTAISAVLSFNASAQTGPAPEQKMNPEQFIEAKAGRIADELALDDSTREKFIDTYCGYFREMHAVCPGPEGRFCPLEKRGPESTADRLTDKEIDKAMRERFDRQQKLLDLRVKYYEEYSKFLNPRQIQKVYDLQMKMAGRHFQHGPHHDRGPQTAHRHFHRHGPEHCCPAR
jgi:Spy/CpxP family protein refolding chaperone